MLIPARYTLTPQISQYLQEIEAAREIIDSIQIPPLVELNIRRQSTLRSSLFSARIEGNPLTLDDLSAKSSLDQKKREVFNILKSLNLVRSQGARDMTIKNILELHKVVLDGLAATETGKFRNQVSAIFNAAGIAVYLPPPPRQILPLITRLVKFTNSSKEQFIPVRAILAHYTFEKIHPFLDGNGRLGRLLLQKVLEKGGYGMKGLASIEEYLDEHRTTYYRMLEEPEKEVTSYVEFILEALASAAQRAKDLVLVKKEAEAEDFLLPRRLEILQIIKDHKLASFDMIKRRFAKVNERTLRYDLQKLAGGGFIRKRGTTRGVWYEPVKNQS